MPFGPILVRATAALRGQRCAQCSELGVLLLNDFQLPCEDIRQEILLLIDRGQRFGNPPLAKVPVNRMPLHVPRGCSASNLTDPHPP